LKNFIPLVILVCCIGSCKNKPGKYTDEINNKYYHEYALIYNAYGKAPADTTFDQLKNYLDKFPKSFEGWTFLGKVYIDRHDYAKSETAYRTALNYNQKFGPAMAGLGVLFAWTGQLDSASMYLSKAIACGDSTQRNYLDLAIVDIKKGDTSAAQIVDSHFSKWDTLDNLSLICLVAANRELKKETNVTAILSLLQKRNVRDSLLDLYLDDKISGVEFFNQTGQDYSNGK